MEKQVVQKRWKLIFWGLTAAAVALLAPGLVLTLEPALFLGLGVLAAVVFCTGLCTTRPCGRRRASPLPAQSAAGSWR